MQSIATRVLSVVLCIFPRVYGYFIWADFRYNRMYSAAYYYVKRSRRIYEKANDYNEDAFRLNVSKNRFKTFEEKAN